jgi:hypothetical protein
VGIPLTQPEMSPTKSRRAGALARAEAPASASGSGTGASRAVQGDRPTKPESAERDTQFADYEVRRELLRADRIKGLARLDALKDRG